MFKGDQGHLHTTVAVLCWNHRGNAPEMCKRLGPEKRRRSNVEWWGGGEWVIPMLIWWQDLMQFWNGMLPRFVVVVVVVVVVICGGMCLYFTAPLEKTWLFFDGLILCIFSALCFFCALLKLHHRWTSMNLAAGAGRMYMAPDPHDVLYENLAEDDINASSWKWLGCLA